MTTIPQQIIDPFHRALYEEVAPKIDERMVQLAGGSVKTYEQYQREVGYIGALNDVLNICKEIETARYGKRPGQDDDAARD